MVSVNYDAGMEIQKVFYQPTPQDMTTLQKVSSWTKREAEKGNMVYRSLEAMQQIAKRGDSYVLFVDGVEAAHAARTHIYSRRTGPFGMLRQHIHEIGAVATEEGFEKNGFAKDIITEAVRYQMKFSTRLRRREVLKPQVIAMVQVDNVRSNRFFAKLGLQVTRDAIPNEAYDTESVGVSERAHDYNTYDITNLGK